MTQEACHQSGTVCHLWTWAEYLRDHPCARKFFFFFKHQRDYLWKLLQFTDLGHDQNFPLILPSNMEHRWSSQNMYSAIMQSLGGGTYFSDEGLPWLWSPHIFFFFLNYQPWWIEPSWSWWYHRESGASVCVFVAGLLLLVADDSNRPSRAVLNGLG